MDKNVILSSTLNQILKKKTYLKSYVLRLTSLIKTYNYLWTPAERDMTHISTLFEATKTWSNPPDKRRVNFLESDDKTSAAHIAIKC